MAAVTEFGEQIIGRLEDFAGRLGPEWRWYVTERAIRQYMALQGSASRKRSLEELRVICWSAEFGQQTKSGASYDAKAKIGTRTERLYLAVSYALVGELPQLVCVRLRGRGSRGAGAAERRRIKRSPKHA